MMMMMMMFLEVEVKYSIANALSEHSKKNEIPREQNVKSAIQFQWITLQKKVKLPVIGYQVL